jgi:hypothetical protein
VSVASDFLGRMPQSSKNLFECMTFETSRVTQVWRKSWNLVLRRQTSTPQQTFSHGCRQE